MGPLAYFCQRQTNETNLFSWTYCKSPWGAGIPVSRLVSPISFVSPGVFKAPTGMTDRKKDPGDALDLGQVFTWFQELTQNYKRGDESNYTDVISTQDLAGQLEQQFEVEVDRSQIAIWMQELGYSCPAGQPGLYMTR